MIFELVEFWNLSVALSAAPASESSQNQDLADQISALQKQLSDIQNAIGQQQQQPEAPEDVKQIQSVPQGVPNRALRSMAWQPMKRMVAWQPMKRSDPIATSDFTREQRKFLII